MSLIGRFKRDITKHRGRSAVLGVLVVGFMVATVKAVADLHGPQTAVASTVHPQPVVDAPAAAVNGADAESRIAQSKQLWQTLREVKGSTRASADVAFAFDASYYPPPAIDMVKIHTPAAETQPVKQTPAPAAEDMAERHRQNIIDQSRSLVLKTTAVGNGNSPPMAIINQQLLTLGQEINGFMLTAIRAREVECIKEGVTVVVKMPEGQ